MGEIILKGIPAAAGIAFGNAYIYGTEKFDIFPTKILEERIPNEIARFEDALIATRKEILDIQDKIAKEMGVEHAEIFDAHLLVLEDRMLIEEVISQIKKDRFVVEYIFSEVLKKYVDVFSRLQDEYLRERISDINDVGKRILKNLLGKDKRKSLDELQGEFIVVSHDLSPSDTASMYKKNVIAFITDIGGRTAHTAIMAKSLEIPAVVGLEKATKHIKNQDLLIVDGKVGLVIINPSNETLEKYKIEQHRFAVQREKFLSSKDLPAKTKDGRRVEIQANIEIPQEVSSVKEHGAEGIGLYRSEYFYMNRSDLPAEEEQYRAYKDAAEAMVPNSVVIRTLDLGGDKFLSQMQVPKEMASFLGWRAIRFCLARPDIFKAQLRAILRASAHGKLKLMYPMISGIEELRQANSILEEVKEELVKKGINFDKDIQVGAMIEVPSAAVTADLLAKEVDFFSIGTNDLIQYALAVDRTNEKIAYLYEPTHPAVLRLIKDIIDAGHKADISVGMCGEMTGEPSLVLLLLGLGLDEFSMPFLLVPKIKQLVRSVSYEDMKQLAHKALELSTVKEVENFIFDRLKELVPDIYEEDKNAGNNRS